MQKHINEFVSRDNWHSVQVEKQHKSNNFLFACWLFFCDSFEKVAVYFSVRLGRSNTRNRRKLNCSVYIYSAISADRENKYRRKYAITIIIFRLRLTYLVYARLGIDQFEIWFSIFFCLYHKDFGSFISILCCSVSLSIVTNRVTCFPPLPIHKHT